MEYLNNQDKRTWDTGGFLPVTTYTSPSLTGSGSVTVENGTATGGASASFSITNGSLHGAATGFSTVDNTLCNCNGEGVGSFYGNWIDTIYITCLPVGTPVDLLLTNTLHSFTDLAGSPTNAYNFAQISSLLSLGGNSVPTLDNFESARNGMITSSIIIHTQAGDALGLEHQLVGNANTNTLQPPSGGQILFSSASADASNTSNSFISVLTSGASYTTASGVNYAPSVVPEPSSLLMAGLLLIGVLAGTLRRGATQKI